MLFGSGLTLYEGLSRIFGQIILASFVSSVTTVKTKISLLNRFVCVPQIKPFWLLCSYSRSSEGHKWPWLCDSFVVTW